MAEGVISTSAAAIIASKPESVAKAVIADAVADRAAINAAAPAKATKAPTGTASNLDVRNSLAKVTGTALPASAQRTVTAESVDPKTAKARTGGFNQPEIAKLRELVGASLPRAGDDATRAALMGALAVLSAVATGEGGVFADKCAMLREAIAAVRQ